MPAIEQLPYTVEVWTDDGNHLVEIPARASHHAIAVAAFWAATTARPHAYVTLRNRAMVLSERKPA